MSFYRDTAEAVPMLAHYARAWTLLAGWPGALVAIPVIYNAIVRDVGRVAVLALVVALGYSALAVASFLGMGSGARWAWWTAMATNVPRSWSGAGSRVRRSTA